MPRLFPAILLPVLLACTSVSALDAGERPFDMGDFENAPHDYWQTPPQDRFSRLIAAAAAHPGTLDTSGERAFLLSLLKGLEIPLSSQLLVYSATSLQKRLIHPENPRALYFNEDTYVGFVAGGRVEIASYDRDLGMVFFIFDPLRSGGAIPRHERPEGCLNCHAEAFSSFVPGFTIESVAVSGSGASLETFRRGEMGHTVPLADRFGGWHLTGGGSAPLGHENTLGTLSEGTLTQSRNLPGSIFAWDRFPVRSSDALAHLIHEHQAGFLNQLIQLQYLERRLLKAPAPGDEGLFSKLLETFANYILFKDEATLPKGGIPGDPDFKAQFLSRKNPASGVDFRVLDLKTRLFATRCSYLLQTPVWEGASLGLKTRFYKILSASLAQEKSHLTAGEKQVIQGWIAARPK